MAVRYRASSGAAWSYINDADSYKFVNVSDCYSSHRIRITFSRYYENSANGFVLVQGSSLTHYGDIFTSSPVIDWDVDAIDRGVFNVQGQMIRMVNHRIRVRTVANPNNNTFVDWSNYGTKDQQTRLFPESEYLAKRYRIIIFDTGSRIKSDCNTCRLVAYKQGVVVFNQAFSTCPQAEIAQGCPDNTCEVLCGNTICCYNSEGISVFNYPNT